MFPERQEFVQNECVECKGTGRRINPKWFQGCDESISPHITCTECGGLGHVAPGPYSKIMVRPLKNALEGQQIPFPTVVYTKRDIEIIKVMEQSVENHLYASLATINFEFLAKTPLAESAVAKLTDKDESNNTAHAVAEDVIYGMDSIYRLVALYRYGHLYLEDEIQEMLPTIPVPDRFDFLSIASLQKELQDAKTAKLNPRLLNQMETDLADKRWNADDEVRDELVLVLKLDPLANITEDDKLIRLSNKGITQETYVISSNIHEFIQRAIEEDPKFPELELQKQKEDQTA